MDAQHFLACRWWGFFLPIVSFIFAFVLPTHAILCAVPCCTHCTALVWAWLVIMKINRVVDLGFWAGVGWPATAYHRLRTWAPHWMALIVCVKCRTTSCSKFSLYHRLTVRFCLATSLQLKMYGSCAVSVFHSRVNLLADFSNPPIKAFFRQLLVPRQLRTRVPRLLVQRGCSWGCNQQQKHINR